jgi:predicted transcriptional regulator
MREIRKIIKRRGLKKNWIAEQLNISQPALSMYLNEKRSIPQEIEIKLKKTLGI